MPYPTPTELVAWFDANPGRYKQNPLPDDYNPTDELSQELARQYPIANPAPQENVYQNIPTVPGTKALLGDTSKGRLSDQWWNTWTQGILGAQSAITPEETERRNTLQEYADNAFQRTNITADELAAINDYVSGNIPDPDYPAQVPGPSDSEAQWGIGGIDKDFINQALSRT